MLGLFKPKARCSVDAVVKEWVDQRWEWLMAQFGADRLRRNEAVLPNDNFFPDAYQPSAEYLEAIADRVAVLMGLNPDFITVQLFQDANKLTGNRAGGLYLGRDDDGVSQIGINITTIEDVGNLIATLAHEYAHIYLLGDNRIDPEEYDHEQLTDLTTVYFGMGVITANHCMYSKAWNYGQMEYTQIGRIGYLDMHQYGYALAKYAETRGDRGVGWSDWLRSDIRKGFRESFRFLEETPDGTVDPPRDTADPSKLRLWKLAQRDPIVFDRLTFVYEIMRTVDEIRETPSGYLLHADELRKITEQFAWDVFDKSCHDTLAAWGLIDGMDLQASLQALHSAGLIREFPADHRVAFESLGPILTGDAPEEDDENPFEDSQPVD
jgi:hypothetical protein